MDDQRLGQTPLAHITRDAIGLIAGALARASHTLYALRGAFTDLTIAREIPYGSGQRLDVWKHRDGGPAVLFFHGGGFQQLDKQSHWAFSERFARMGAVVFNADYRLAPAHRHPAAAHDAARAYDWVRTHAARYGADPSQLIVAGTSAGANLALGLAITHSANAAVLFSGLLQVSDMARLYRSRASVPLALRARMASIGVEYPPEGLGWELPAEPDPTLDPLLYIERHGTSGLPALFVSTGSVDNVLEDSLRLCARLDGVPHELDIVAGAGHAFQGFSFRASVRAMWRRCARFLAMQGLRVSQSPESPECVEFPSISSSARRPRAGPT